MTVKQQLQQAFRLHQGGHVADAADLYAAVLRSDPQNIDALNLLGSIMIEAGQLDTGIQLCQEAVRVAPDFFGPYVNLGNGLQAAGRLVEAVEAFQKAVELKTDNAVLFNNLASALNALDRFDEGRAAAEKAAALEPRLAEAYNNLGNACLGAGDQEAAEQAFQSALEINPQQSDVLYNLGTLMSKTGREQSAVSLLERAVSLDPSRVEKVYNLGLAYSAVGRYEDAQARYRTCLQMDPNHEDALNNLSVALKDLGRLGEAEALLRDAIVKNPNDADLHWNLAQVLLHKGDFEEGWREYEWRWDMSAFTTPKRDFGKPQWTGEDAAGKTILIHHEQGFGDAIQMVRYLPLVAARCDHVILECRPGLERLLAPLDGVDQVVTMGQDLPSFDVHLPIMSLPHVFGTMLTTVPNDVPYLHAPKDGAVDPRLVESDKLKVGIVWAGSATLTKDLERSVDAKMFRAVADVEGVEVFSLQLGQEEAFREAFQDLDNVYDLSKSLRDFADTAAHIAALDLVISVDTAVGHLAGALGQPVWGLHAANASYQWLQEREDSPWYPTMRLFRQVERGDWASVLERIVSELRSLVKS